MTVPPDFRPRPLPTESQGPRFGGFPSQTNFYSYYYSFTIVTLGGLTIIICFCFVDPGVDPRPETDFGEVDRLLGGR